MDLRSDRTLLLPALAVGAIVLGGATLWIARTPTPTAHEGTGIPRKVSADRGSAGPTAAAGGGERTSKDGRRFAPVTTAESSSVTGTLDAEDDEALELPAAGAIRFTGLVVTEDDQPLACEGAVVRVYRETDEHGPVLLGTAPVSSSGRFAVELTQFADRSRFGESSDWIYGQVVAPGYHLASDGADLDAAVHGVITVRIETSRGGPMLLGRIVDPTGQPVRGAHVRYIEWGRTAQNLSDGESRSDSDGLFGFQLDDGGWVDVVAVHPSHGMGRAVGRLERPERLLDLGPIVLRPRAVISGVVLGVGGYPLAGHPVDIEPAEDDSDAPSFSVETEPDGTFRCANLDRVPYRLVPDHHAGEWEDQLVVMPDSEGVLLRVPHPSATVSTLAPDGRLVAVDGFSCTAVDADGHATSERWVEERQGRPGIQELLFESPGRYAVGAQVWVDDVRWSARRILTIGKEHRAVELPLERGAGAPVEFRVTDAGGVPVEGWRLRLVDPATRMHVATARSPMVVTHVEPGIYRATVTPASPSLVLPFDAEIEVTRGHGDSPEVVELRGARTGGRVEVSLRSTDGVVAPVDAHVRLRGSRVRATKSISVPVDGDGKSFRESIPAGAYELRLTRRAKVGIPAGKLTWPFELEVGEIKSLSLAFPGH